MTIKRSFEEAGLGKAPFRFIGIHTNPSKSLQEINPQAWNAAVANTPQLDIGGTWSCAYCGTGITEAFIIKSADNKTSAVGCDCIMKLYRSNEKDRVRSGMTELEKEVKKHKNKKATERRNKKYKELYDEFTTLVTEPEFNAYLKSIPHSREWRHKNFGESLLDDLKQGMNYVSLRSNVIERVKKIKADFETKRYL